MSKSLGIYVNSPCITTALPDGKCKAERLNSLLNALQQVRDIQGRNSNKKKANAFNLSTVEADWITVNLRADLYSEF